MLAALRALPAEETGRPRGDPAARLARGGAASEYWDVTAAFDASYFLFVRFLITNVGPGERTGVGLGRLVGPRGEVTEFQYGREASRWAISPDGLTIRVASSLLDLHGPRRRLTIDSGKRAIKIGVDFPADGPAVWTEEPKVYGHRLDVVQMPVAATASIWVGGMSEVANLAGTIAVTHAWMDRNEADLLERRIEFMARQGDLSLYVADLTRPDGGRWQWMALARAGEVVARREGFGLTIGDAAAPSRDGGYPLPRGLEFHGGGLEGEVVVEREVLRTNPLNVVPQPFRFLLSFKTDPRQVWADARFALRLAPQANEGEDLAIDGKGILAVHYSNPMK
jgi:hypothetical protein